MQKVSAWGRLSSSYHDVVMLQQSDSLMQCQHEDRLALPHGMGRSYGDVCLNAGGRLWRTQRLDRFIRWDPTEGLLTCEAGVLLKTIQSLLIPRGFALPVTPGTQWVTVGGAIANDVHGKNHHQQGTLGHHVRSLVLKRTTGETVVCSPVEARPWFLATIGGMGLTGLITEVTLQLMRVPGPWFEVETFPYHTLHDFFDLAHHSSHWPYTVAWIDCLSSTGRGIFMRAQSTHEAPKTKHVSGPFWRVPISMPLLNERFLKVFNGMYFHMHRQGTTLQHYIPFLYPLDHIYDWNRLYGRRGFYQYQCVLPWDTAMEGVSEMLSIIRHAKQGSFLAVLKTFGTQPSLGMMSFVMPGVTLALDFPNHGMKTIHLLKQLDDVVQAAKGRLYFAKNAYMTPTLFESGYPMWRDFLMYRDPGIASDLARRLMGII